MSSGWSRYLSRWFGGSAWTDSGLFYNDRALDVDYEDEHRLQSWLGGTTCWDSDESALDNHLDVRTVCLGCGEIPDACGCP